MGLKRDFKRKVTKAHRKMFGKPKTVMITTGKGGLTKDEIKDVLGTLRGNIPPATYEYRPPSFLDRREPLWVKPKVVSVATLRVKIRALMKAKYGSRYIIA